MRSGMAVKNEMTVLVTMPPILVAFLILLLFYILNGEAGVWCTT